VIIDRPWAIIYGPKAELGPGLMYGLGLTRSDAWENAILVYLGREAGPDEQAKTKAELKRKGMVARLVEVHLP
jgi:hypothetical protein